MQSTRPIFHCTKIGHDLAPSGFALVIHIPSALKGRSDHGQRLDGFDLAVLLQIQPYYILAKLTLIYFLHSSVVTKMSHQDTHEDQNVVQVPQWHEN